MEGDDFILMKPFCEGLPEEGFACLEKAGSSNEAFPAAERRHLPGAKGRIRYFGYFRALRVSLTDLPKGVIPTSISA